MLKKMDKTLLITSLLLFGTGLLMIFSASNITSFMKYNQSTYYYFLHQLIYIFVGLVFSGVILVFYKKVLGSKLNKFGNISRVLMIILIVLLILLLIIGKATNEAKSWFTIVKGVKIQPSEFIKVAAIIWMSYLCGCKLDLESKNNMKIYIELFGAILAVVVLIGFQPDWGTAAIFLITMGLTFFFTVKIDGKIKWIIGGVIVGIGGIFFLLLMNNGAKSQFSRQIGRLTDFMISPCSEERFYDSGTQICNGYIAFNNGGLFGKGLGNSSQKYLYLPYPYTDFIFAIVVEELGFIGGLSVLALIFVLLCRIYAIGRKSKNGMGKMICFGVYVYILIHLFVNLGGVMGLMPLTGVPFPFLTYGGSYALCLMTSLTFVQIVAINNEYEKEIKKIESK